MAATTYNEAGTDWSAYDTYNNAANPSGFGPRDVLWYRIRWDSAATTLYFDYSTDGDQWINWLSRTSQGQYGLAGPFQYERAS